MQDERAALLRRGERRSSLFQSTMIQQQSYAAAAAAAAAVASGNPHILISDASSLYSVEELPDELAWPLRRPSTQSVGAVIVAVREPIHLPPYQPSRVENRNSMQTRPFIMQYSTKWIVI